MTEEEGSKAEKEKPKETANRERSPVPRRRSVPRPGQEKLDKTGEEKRISEKKSKESKGSKADRRDRSEDRKDRRKERRHKRKKEEQEERRSKKHKKTHRGGAKHQRLWRGGVQPFHPFHHKKQADYWDTKPSLSDQWRPRAWSQGASMEWSCQERWRQRLATW